MKVQVWYYLTYYHPLTKLIIYVVEEGAEKMPRLFVYLQNKPTKAKQNKTKQAKTLTTFLFCKIKLPVWKPPVPRVLNSGGAVLDLNPNGNTDTGSLEDTIRSAENDTIDPATLAVQDVSIGIHFPSY